MEALERLIPLKINIYLVVEEQRDDKHKVLELLKV